VDKNSLLLVLGMAPARLLSFVARTFVVALFPELMLRYSVGYTQVGTLYSTYLWVCALCLMPAGVNRIAMFGILAFGLGMVLLLPGPALMAVIGAPLMGMGTTLNPARTGQVVGAMNTVGQIAAAAAGKLFGPLLDLNCSFTSIWLLTQACTAGAAVALVAVRRDGAEQEGRAA